MAAATSNNLELLMSEETPEMQSAQIPFKISAADSTVAENVRKAREASGKSTTECATAIGLGLESYLARESGQERFRSAELLELAKLFPAPMASFFANIRITP